MKFGEYVTEMRQRAGYTISALAAMLGEHRQNVGTLENGKKPPWRNPARLMKLSEVLGLSDDERGKLFELAGQVPGVDRTLGRLAVRGLLEAIGGLTDDQIRGLEAEAHRVSRDNSLADLTP